MLSKVSRRKILELTILRTQIFLMYSSLNLHKLHTYVKENSVSCQSWISLDYRENVLSPVRVRLHRSTGKRTIFKLFRLTHENTSLGEILPSVRLLRCSPSTLRAYKYFIIQLMHNYIIRRYN